MEWSMRWSDEQAARYYASGIWTRRGLRELLDEHPAEKLAFDDGVEAVGYGELRARVDALAGELRVGEGSVVAVRMGNTVEHVVAAYAVATTGAILFELPPDAMSPEVIEALRRTRAVAFLSDAATADELTALRPAAPVGGSDAPDPDAVGLLLGTSGTTGTPKIAMRTTNSSLAMARSVLSRTGIGRDDVVLLAAPLSGGIGYFNGLCSAALTGCSVILAQRFEVDGLLGLLERHQVTALETLPTLLTRMVAGRVVDTGALRVIQSGGAYLHPRTAEAVEARFGCPVVSAYGATDVGVPSMVAAHGDTAAHRHETVGRPFADVELAILDEAGNVLDDGETGEVVMRGPSTALGYSTIPRRPAPCSMTPAGAISATSAWSTRTATCASSAGSRRSSTAAARRSASTSSRTTFARTPAWPTSPPWATTIPTSVSAAPWSSSRRPS
jgi:acyl-CoA synthetase (AMP-forming)/AMP-acid ligase II